MRLNILAIRQLDEVMRKAGSNDMLLVSIDPSRDHGDDDLQDHGDSSGWRHCYGSAQRTTRLRKINRLESAEYFNLTVLAVSMSVSNGVSW
jgi:hypothetical protein